MTGATKRCTKCGDEKPLEQFYGRGHRNGRLLPGVRSQCMRCVDEITIRWQQANRRKVNSYARVCQQKRRKKDPEGVKAAKRRDYRRHPEVTRARDRKWIRLNPTASAESSRARCATRRSRIAGGGGRYTRSDLKRIYVTQGGLCYYCSAELNGKYHADHKIPISRGGSSWPENIACACPPCNTSKNARTDDEFFELLRTA
jgi:5-methylcytosine-specific restriction endonuclease McrA